MSPLQDVDVSKLRHECYRLFSQESIRTYFRKNARQAPYQDAGIWLVAVCLSFFLFLFLSCC
jgi:hypothetical protein